MVTYVISGGNLCYNWDNSWLKIYLSYELVSIFKEVIGIRWKQDTKKLSKLTFQCVFRMFGNFRYIFDGFWWYWEGFLAPAQKIKDSCSMAASAASAGPGNSANAARMEMEHGHKGSNGLRQTINPATRTAGKESQSWVVGERKFMFFVQLLL